MASSGEQGEQDAALLAEIAAGSAAAVGVLYDRYAPLLYAVALRILRSPADAEDVVHDAMLTVTDRAALYAPTRGSVSAWLVTVTRNMSIDRVRRTRSRAALAERFGGEPAAADAAPNAEALLASSREAEAVRQAVAALPVEQQRILMASFFEGLTYTEIAEAEDVPLGTIKSRAARAIASLRASLGGGDGEH